MKLALASMLLLVPALAYADPDPKNGQCELTASGAKEAHETIPGNGNGSVMSEYWFGDAEKAEAAKQKGATKDAVDALKLLTINCQGKDIRVSIVPGEGATAKTIPFAAKTYKLAKGKGELAVLARVKDTSIINLTGTISVTAFDGKHIAATIDLAGETMKHEAVKLSGKLDYPCKATGCAK